MMDWIQKCIYTNIVTVINWLEWIYVIQLQYLEIEYNIKYPEHLKY